MSETERLTRSLVEAVEAALPAGLDTSCEHDDWPLLGYAMLASCAAAARDVQTLADVGSVGSTNTVTRRLYELVVTLAWVCMAPVEHPVRWLRSDRAHRIRIDDDLVERGHEPLLEAETRLAFAATLGTGKQMPDLLQRAEEADRYWSTIVDWLDDASTSTRSLRSMYRYLYRRYSSDAHGGVGSVEHHVTATGRRGVAHVDEVHRDEPDTMAPILLAIAFVVAGRTLGVDDPDATVDAIFAA